MQMRKVKKPNTERSEKFRELGAVVHDVSRLLEHLARIEAKLIVADQRERVSEHLVRAQRTAMLVASHALGPIVGELNDLSLASLDTTPNYVKDGSLSETEESFPF